MAKANSEATAERVDQLQGMILAGQPNRLSHICATNMGGLTVPGLPAAEEGMGADHGRHRRERHRPAGAAVVVNPDADGRGWTGDAAEEPGRRGERHPPARSHDRHRIQLPPRPRRTPLICIAQAASDSQLRALVSLSGGQCETNLR